LADIELFNQIRAFFTLVFTEEDRKHFQNVTNWYTGFGSDPSVIEVCGVTRLGKVTQKPPKKIEHKQPEAKKEEKKKEQPKKEEKKEEKKGGEEEGDDEGPISKKKECFR